MKGPTNECGSVIKLLSNKCVWNNAPFALRQPTLAQLMISYKQSLWLVALCCSYVWIEDILHVYHSLCAKEPNILFLLTLGITPFTHIYVFGRSSFLERLKAPFITHFARCICMEMSTIFSRRWRLLWWLSRSSTLDTIKRPQNTAKCTTVTCLLLSWLHWCWLALQE